MKCFAVVIAACLVYVWGMCIQLSNIKTTKICVHEICDKLLKVI